MQRVSDESTVASLAFDFTANRGRPRDFTRKSTSRHAVQLAPLDLDAEMWRLIQGRFAPASLLANS